MYSNHKLEHEIQEAKHHIGECEWRIHRGLNYRNINGASFDDWLRVSYWTDSLNNAKAGLAKYEAELESLKTEDM